MPETRKIFKYTYPEGLLPEQKIPANATIEETSYEVSDEQLAEEAEERALSKADELIDAIDSLAKAKVFLKRLCARLIKKGLLP